MYKIMRIGVVGNQESIDHFNTILRNIPEFKLANSFNTEENSITSYQNTFNEKLYKSFLNSIDTVIVSRTTGIQYKYAIKAIRETKHVYIQEPYLLSPKSLNKLIRTANEANSIFKLQEKARFHPLVKAIVAGDTQTGIIHLQHRKKYIENSHRSIFNITKDLVFDIELCLVLAGSNIKKIQSKILPNCGNHVPEMITARIDFDNGTKADIHYNICSRSERHNGILYKLNETTEFDLLDNSFHQVNTLLFDTQTSTAQANEFDKLYYDLKYFLNIIEHTEKSLTASYNSYAPFYAMEQILKELFVHH
jgi:hypothetical protein